jgi:hypothetical protein
MNYRRNTDNTAVVAPAVHWMPIDENTPLGVSMWLINKASGVSQKGMHFKGDTFFDHWFPNPTFPKDIPCSPSKN